MAEQSGRRRRKATPASQNGKGDTAAFVILRVDELPSDPEGEHEPGMVRIGERLTVVKVVMAPEGTGRDKIAREHRKAMDAEWAKAREAGSHPEFPDGLPERFPRHLYRVVAVSAFQPGHYAEETRQVAFGTF